MRDLLPLAAMLGAAVAVYIIRERARRRAELRPARPDLAMSEFAAEHTLREDLIGIERQAAASDHPRRAIRLAMVRGATMALHLEAIAALPETERQVLLKGYQPGMDAMLQTALRSHRETFLALRQYARLKYDDWAENDWFDRFLHEAGPYIREKVRLARDSLMQMDPAAGQFAEIYDALLEDLAARLVAAPPKQTFPPADLA